METGNSRLSREARLYQKDYLQRMAAKSSEEMALVLAYTKEACNNSHAQNSSAKIPDAVTFDSILKNTMLNTTKIRELLMILDAQDFIRRKKIGHKWVYSITQEGNDALSFMLDECNFIGRKKKIAAILEAKKKEGFR